MNRFEYGDVLKWAHATGPMRDNIDRLMFVRDFDESVFLGIVLRNHDPAWSGGETWWGDANNWTTTDE